MKKFLSFLLLLSIILTSCEKPRPALNCETYIEATDPDTTDYSAEWSKVNGLNISFGSINKRYPKAQVPDVPQSQVWKGSGWKGERIAAMLVLWTDENVEQVECEFSDFKNENGSVLKSSTANAQFIKYVITDSYGDGCAPREHLRPSLVADALDTVKCFNIEARTTRPVWLSFDIPDDAKTGTYTGTVNVYARDKKTTKLNVFIDVLPHTLPKPESWKFHLDLWQHPSAIARIHNVPAWSEEHWKLMEKPMSMLASTGQKVITTTLNKDPWNVQTFDAYADMILWTKKKDSSWEYNYAIFDRWVEMMMELGVKDMINCYSMAPWNNELHYFDEIQNKKITVNPVPGSKEFKEVWSPFLKDFCKHLKEKGWLDITNIAMDERSPEIMKATMGLLKEAAPELGVALADNHKSYKQYPYLKDICVEYGATFEAADLQYRKQNGLISTYYVYCGTKFPNVFTFSDPAEAVYISWFSIANDYDGFLRWAYNSWPENPLLDSRYKTWSAGDTYIIYPGGRSSIRFERLKEGIQDAEKIRILRDKFEDEGNSEKLDLLNNELSKFKIIGEPAEPCTQMVDNAKKMLEKLSR
ncbi:hypothetical protein GGR21_000059 [Dysgonomonas hofstadii]|uniref:Glycoside hydrolase 123 C-terminal domain-containing protein n=1 Tax=Dysgonomonas hofstadii TaxID=637886 RepID=A0A840CL75_9BACT|nr:DUF4091 domain-containing protein [Dysgonomonas hofstadii]MBB4034174.1 hypothetical protein [Dysgonomonas hofstadii]